MEIGPIPEFPPPPPPDPPQGDRKWQCGTREGRAEYQLFSCKSWPDMEQHVTELMFKRVEVFLPLRLYQFEKKKKKKRREA